MKNWIKITIIVIYTFISVSDLSYSANAKFIWLDELNASRIELLDKLTSNSNNIATNDLNLSGKTFERGFSIPGNHVMWINLDGWTSHFYGTVGLSDASDADASAEFKIYGKGKLLWESGLMTKTDHPKEVKVTIRGVKILKMQVTSASKNILAIWADAKLRVTGKDPFMLNPLSMKPYILTPKPGKKPKINSPDVFGLRPSNPLFLKIPATGQKPILFSAANLPSDLKIDRNKGLITGKISKKGNYNITLIAENKFGQYQKNLEIKVDSAICLTPPMGWNSWNCWGASVDSAKIKEAANAMAQTGLAEHGWSYINIDDSWQGQRGGEFNAIMPNEKFSQMQDLCGYIHDLGLKIGIYSTPWITSYAGYIGGSSDNPNGAWSRDKDGSREGWRHGKYSFAHNDVRQWEKWGIDYLKYDWNPNDIDHVTEMTALLLNSDRDIIYSLSNTAPFENASQLSRLANCWRTTGDITDTWESISEIGFSQAKWADFASPGHWNDADMLVVGNVGWGMDLHPSKLLPDEQYTHISLWCLLSSPLLLGCDLTKIDDFTMNLLTNDEVISVNQDPAGKQAKPVVSDGEIQVYSKEMIDGSIAVGIFNLSDLSKDPESVLLEWDMLGINGRHTVRDLWKQEDLGAFQDKFSVQVKPHGVVLLRVIPE